MPARAYRLRTKDGVAEGMRRIALGRTEKALDELASADHDELASAIHGARKDLKKMRAVLRLIRVELGEDLFKSENSRYRDAGRLLSGTRDAEVKLETLSALRDRFGEDLPTLAARQWKATLERERNEVVDAAHGETAGQIDAAGEAIEEGRVRILGWPLEADDWSLVGPGLAKGYERGRRAMKRTLAEPRPENVHEWRKRAKDLWYQLRIVREAWPSLLGETADQAHALADLLGDHHDLAVLADDLASRDEIGAKSGFGDAIERRQDELLAAALELGERLYAEKPKAFKRRLKRFWLAWRGA
jgi:CHAD domain-containing protein